ncbi:MAG: ATP-binding cassette domain-containing protein [Ardenticatenales bacterium]
MNLQITDLTFARGDRTILDGLSLTVASGERCVILGPSGSGKTTLLRLIAGLERPAGGEIRLDGTVVSAPPPARMTPPHARGIAMALQFPALWPHMTVLDNVTFGLAAHDRRGAQAIGEARLADVGLAGYGGRYPHQLSGGEAKRVALARALAPDRPLLLLDEPLVHVEPALRDTLLAVIDARLRASGATVVYVTHDAAEGDGVGGRQVWMKDGRVQ